MGLMHPMFNTRCDQKLSSAYSQAVQITSKTAELDSYISLEVAAKKGAGASSHINKGSDLNALSFGEGDNKKTCGG